MSYKHEEEYMGRNNHNAGLHIIWRRYGEYDNSRYYDILDNINFYHNDISSSRTWDSFCTTGSVENVRPDNKRKRHKKNGVRNNKVNSKIYTKKKSLGDRVTYNDVIVLYSFDDNEEIEHKIEENDALLSPISRMCINRTRGFIFSYAEYKYKLLDFKHMKSGKGVSPSHFNNSIEK